MRFFEICINIPLNTNAEKKSSILNKYLLVKPIFYSTVHVDAWLCKFLFWYAQLTKKLKNFISFYAHWAIGIWPILTQNF